MLLLVVYDVSDARLRRRLAKVLGGYGYRVQQSAFECRLRGGERRALVRRIGDLVADAGTGTSVRVYPLGEQAAGRVRELGSGPPVTADEDVLFA